MAHVPPGASVVDRELFPREAVRRNACYGEFLQRLDVHSLLTAIMVKERSFSTVATFGRSERAGEWDSDHCEIMRLLAPHLRLAADSASGSSVSGAAARARRLTHCRRE